MVDNSNMPHPKCLGSHKNPGTEPKTCEKGPKLGFEYLPTSKTSHCVRTACMAFPGCVLKTGCKEKSLRAFLLPVIGAVHSTPAPNRSRLICANMTRHLNLHHLIPL